MDTQPADEPTRHDVRRPPTQGQVGEAWRHRQAITPEQAAADTAHRRQTAQEQSYNPTTTPPPAPTQADDPNGQPGWLLASLGGLAAALALIAGLVVLAIRRAGRRARVGYVA